jgi:hypothetical protein
VGCDRHPHQPLAAPVRLARGFVAPRAAVIVAMAMSSCSAHDALFTPVDQEDEGPAEVCGFGRSHRVACAGRGSPDADRHCREIRYARLAQRLFLRFVTDDRTEGEDEFV